MLGRGATLGVDDDPLSSSIYFFGEHVSHHRTTRLWEGVDGRPFHKVTLRKQWVDHLVKNQTNSGLSQSAKNDLFDWVRTTRLSAEELLAIW